MSHPGEELGMTPEQWEIFQQWTTGFPNQDENGIDLSLLRANLKLTPDERLTRLEQGAAFLQEIRRARTAAAIPPDH